MTPEQILMLLMTAEKIAFQIGSKWVEFDALKDRDALLTALEKSRTEGFPQFKFISVS